MRVTENFYYYYYHYCYYLIGVIITGGEERRDRYPTNREELLIPSEEFSCELPQLPEPLREHTYEGGLICGGREQNSVSKYCYQRTGNKWERLKFTITARNGHSAWNSSRGLVLIGGDHTATATVLVTRHEERKYFDLKHRTK